MSKIHNKKLIGQKFGKLVVIKKASTKGKSMWLVKCDCGNEKIVYEFNLLSGASQSCRACVYPKKQEKKIYQNRCKNCNKEFELTSRRKYCYECVPYKDRKVRSSINHKINQANILLKIKGELGNECYLCGYNECIKALEFHHKNPKEKIKNISSILNYEEALNESRKCVLLCANCHREAHYSKYKFDST